MSLTYTATTAGYNLEEIRQTFPALWRKIDGQELVYLDCAATSLRPAMVIDKGCDFCKVHDGNPHRGMHTLSNEATEHYEACRTRVSNWLGAPSDESVVITRNATAAINLVARGLKHNLSKGDEIVLTEMEHHANLIPWQMLAKETQAVLKFISVQPNGELALEQLPALITQRTKIVSAVHVSNVLGTINPISVIAKAAHRVGALLMVDAAQSVGHMPVDLSSLDADFLVFSAHKCYGPSGLGFLIGKPEAMELLQPVEYGGDMIEYVTLNDATWAPIPHRFEAGTANAQAAAAFPTTIDFIQKLGIDNVRGHEIEITEYAIKQLSGLPDLKIIGPLDAKRRGGLVTFIHQLVPPHDMATILNERGIAIRAGHHCAQPLHRKLGLPASIRASFGVYTNKADIDALVAGIEDARKLFLK